MNLGQEMWLRVFNNSGVLIENGKRSLDQSSVNIIRTTSVLFSNLKNKLNSYAKIIDIVDPVNTLKRGFSLTRLSNGEVLKSIDQVKKGTRIETEVFNGRIKSSVIDIQEENL